MLWLRGAFALLEQFLNGIIDLCLLF